MRSSKSVEWNSHQVIGPCSKPCQTLWLCNTGHFSVTLPVEFIEQAALYRTQLCININNALSQQHYHTAKLRNQLCKYSCWPQPPELPPIPQPPVCPCHCPAGNAFYRAESAQGRDLAVLAAAVYRRTTGQLRVLDVMAGSGMRGARYLQQVRPPCLRRGGGRRGGLKQTAPVSSRSSLFHSMG